MKKEYAYAAVQGGIQEEGTTVSDSLINVNYEGILVIGIQKESSNIFLRSLLSPDYASISRYFTRATFSPRSLILAAGHSIHYLDFPEDGILALSADADARPPCLTALIGREGFVGWPSLMDGSHSPYHIRAGGEGASLLRLDISRTLSVIDERPTLRASLFRFVHAVMMQMHSTIISSKTDPIERRLARLVLMHHDRANGDDICVTHQDMADMLMVRRASITDALHVMEGDRLIVSTRNKIVMRNRADLCQVAGKTYGLAEEHYSQWVTPLFDFGVKAGQVEHRTRENPPTMG